MPTVSLGAYALHKDLFTVLRNKVFPTTGFPSQLPSRVMDRKVATYGSADP